LNPPSLAIQRVFHFQEIARESDCKINMLNSKCSLHIALMSSIGNEIRIRVFDVKQKFSGKLRVCMVCAFSAA
jgi:hypothetical protein